MESVQNNLIEQELQEDQKSEYYELIGKIQRKEIRLSYSSLKQFYNTPKSFIKYKLKKFEKTPAMIMGSLLDVLILTPETFNTQFIVMDSVPSTDSQLGFCRDIMEGLSKEDAFARNYKRGDIDKVYDSLIDYIKAKESGKDIISNETLEKATSIKDSVLANPTALSFLEKATHFQEMLEWEQGGFKHIGFLDVRGPGFIMDLKYKSQSADINDFQWDFKKLHYDLQAGIYCKASEILGLEVAPKYYIMVYDAKGEVSVIEIDRSYIMYGQQKHELILQEFKECASRNEWNMSHDFYAHDKGVHTLVKPRFAELKKSIK